MHLTSFICNSYQYAYIVRRPTEGTHTCKVDQKATTIIIKIIKEASAIPFSSDNFIHKLCVIDSDLLVNNLCSNHFFGQVSSGLFASSMPELTYSMLDPVMGRLYMETHDYQDLGYHSLCSFKDDFLIGFLN